MLNFPNLKYLDFTLEISVVEKYCFCNRKISFKVSSEISYYYHDFLV